MVLPDKALPRPVAIQVAPLLPDDDEASVGREGEREDGCPGLHNPGESPAPPVDLEDPVPSSGGDGRSVAGGVDRGDRTVRDPLPEQVPPAADEMNDTVVASGGDVVAVGCKSNGRYGCPGSCREVPALLTLVVKEGDAAAPHREGPAVPGEGKITNGSCDPFCPVAVAARPVEQDDVARVGPGGYVAPCTGDGNRRYRIPGARIPGNRTVLPQAGDHPSVGPCDRVSAVCADRNVVDGASHRYAGNHRGQDGGKDDHQCCSSHGNVLSHAFFLGEFLKLFHHAPEKVEGSR
ncbi:MAG: hypothetical protein BWX50_01045 [Euryarchaeota archaeon ADurb.Bin009]|nr:MAG: hypothetical protein BWX50_01045 [Euryarchaeota archaeon ADurb.Bin009]